MVKCLRPHMPSVAYASTNLASGMMHSVFMFYYVKVFLDRYHVSEAWFQVSQVLYMIWNAINDPLFGYFQDNFDFSWVKSRRHSILYGAPFFAVSFLIPWFPWADYSKPENGWICGLHLLVALCFYDTLFTFVLLAQCALFAEMSKVQEDRLRLVYYAQIASLIGSSSVFLCETISNNIENYSIFQITCVFMALASWWFLRYTGVNAHTEYDLQNIRSSNASKLMVIEEEPSNGKTPSESIWKLMWQIMKEIDFITFVLMNFCQIYHATYLSNFTRILCDNLVPKSIFPSTVRSFFFGSTFFMPQLIVILGTPLVSKFGYYRVIMASFILKTGWGIAMLIIGREHQYIFLVFLLLETISANGIFSLFNMCLSDVIDKDIQQHNRKYPLSSMVFGTNALITKPAISFAPMLAVWLFNKYGYEQLSHAKTSAVGNYSELFDTMFILTTLTPVIIGLLQAVVWSRYTIRNSHEIVPKHVES